MEWLLSALGFDGSNPQVQAGLLQFLGVLFTGGIAVATWYFNRRRDRAIAERHAQDRQDDLRTALWSDILPIWLGLVRLGTPGDKLKRIGEAFDEARIDGDRAYTPFVFPASEPLFSARLVQDVAALNNDEIEPVVKFYHQLARLNQMARSAREPDFAALSVGRKEKVLVLITKLEIRAEAEAYDALVALEKRMELGPNEPDMVMRARRERVALTDQTQRSGS